MLTYQTLIVLLQSMLAHGFSPYFYMEFTDMTYANAVIFCQNKGMELVTIKNTEVNGMVSQYLQDRGVSDRVWISLECPSLVCSWPDGQPLSWSSWIDVDEPGDECVVIEDVPSGRWRGRRCDDVYLPLCYGLTTTVSFTEAAPPTSDISTSNNGNGFTSEASSSEAAISTTEISTSNFAYGFTSEASTTEAAISTTEISTSNFADGFTSEASTTEAALPTSDISTSDNGNGFTSEASSAEAALPTPDISTSNFANGFTLEASTTEAAISTTEISTSNFADGFTSEASTAAAAISTTEISTSNFVDGFTSAASITDIVTSTFESGGDFIQQVFTVDSINSLPITQPYVTHTVRSRLQCAGKCLRSKPVCTAFVYNDPNCNLYNDYSNSAVIGSPGSIVWD